MGVRINVHTYMKKVASQLTSYILRNSNDPEDSLLQLELAIDRLPIPTVDKDMYKAFHLDIELSDDFMLKPESDEADGGMGFRPEYLNEMYRNLSSITTDAEVSGSLKRMISNFLKNYSPAKEPSKPKVVKRDRDGNTSVVLASNLAKVYWLNCK